MAIQVPPHFFLATELYTHPNFQKHPKKRQVELKYLEASHLYNVHFHSYLFEWNMGCMAISAV